MVIIKCSMCEKELYLDESKALFDVLPLHSECFEIVERRIIDNFWELLTLPEDEFNEWLSVML